MLLRKPGKILLGKSTPFHLYCACLFGAWLAFAPGFRDAPALWVVLASLICVLPVNMGLASLTALALFEHWMMVLPLPDAALWRWLLPSPKETKYEKHEAGPTAQAEGS